jgi:hypothetical protein
MPAQTEKGGPCFQPARGMLVRWRLVGRGHKQSRLVPVAKAPAAEGADKSAPLQGSRRRVALPTYPLLAECLGLNAAGRRVCPAGREARRAGRTAVPGKAGARVPRLGSVAAAKMAKLQGGTRLEALSSLDAAQRDCVGGRTMVERSA